MTTLPENKSFRDMHKPSAPFVIPNPWDAGSARILEGLGFSALATTSSGFALTRGRHDYGVTRKEVIDHCTEVVSAVAIPVTADLENGFGAAPDAVAETVRQASAAGLAGGSIEDTTGDSASPIFDLAEAVERIAAAVEAAESAPDDFVLTARADGHLHLADLSVDDTIARLKAFEEAGADVLYAPGLPDIGAVKAVCDAFEKPVNVLVTGALASHSVDEFAAAGAARLSIGGALAWSAYGTLAASVAMLQGGGFDVLRENGDGAKTAARFLKDR